MTSKMESLGALAGATEANMEAANFTGKQYPVLHDAATPSAHVGIAALRVVHLAARHGLTIERAAILAPFVFEGNRA